ncbi:zf-HC2 domain-containing protein [Catenuloplanes sp. NPDC051500]|uniref:zf-HC2 domain-containing protein n=1 Tax=Catenuloplanes sp. NPDC051500 TaxID=3363959 RepID=UPI00378CF63E
MTDDRDDAMAERASLALYLLGALPDDERVDFERHLAGCDRCLAEALDLGPSTSGLGQFSDDDIHEFLTAVGNDDTSIPEPEPPAPAVVTAPVPRTRPARHDPPSGPPDNRPGRASRRRRNAIFSFAAVLVLVVAGVSFAFLRLGGSAGGPADADLVAIAEATSAGVSLSVTVTETPIEGTTARVTISGLQDGTLYRLYVVAGEQTVVIRDFTGESGTQQVNGRLTVPVAEVAFFSVRVVDGPTVVNAYVAGSSPTPR